MNIAILGTGNVGTAIGTALVREGHQVRYGSRTPGSGADRVYGVGKDVTAGTNKDAVAFGEVVILAIPYKAVAETVAQVSAGAFKGKVVVDCTNPIGVSLPLGSSAAEEVQKILPGVPVVKAFNAVFAEHMKLGRIGAQRLVLPVAGEDAKAKKTVIDLGNSLGFEALDAGPLAHARNAEAMAMQLIHWGYGAKMGTGMGWALARKK